MSEQTEPKTGLLAEIIHVLGIAGTTLLAALGCVYAFMGNIYLAGVVAVMFGAGFYLLVYLLAKRKQQKNQEESMLRQERLFLLVYALTALTAFVFVFHGTDIELTRKNTLKKSGQEKLDKVDDLLTAYEAEIARRENSFRDNTLQTMNTYLLSNNVGAKGELERVLGAGSVNFKASRSDIESQVQAAIRSKNQVLRNGLEPDGDLVQRWETAKKSHKSAFADWKRTQVKFAYYDIDDWYKKLYDNALSKMPDFKYEAFINLPDVGLTSPLKALGQAPASSWGLGLGLFLLLQAAILAPYFSIKRQRSRLHKSKYKEDTVYTGEIRL